MTTEALERVLRLVAEGRLTAEEAAPILDALETAAPVAGDTVASAPRRDGTTGGERRAAKTARIEVFERGKRVVNLRIPVSLGRFALSRVPGLSPAHIEEVEEAIAGGQTGPILDVEDEDGDGVRILVE